jgi:diguanylate cyclase (GGDEF)-like protein
MPDAGRSLHSRGGAAAGRWAAAAAALLLVDDAVLRRRLAARQAELRALRSEVAALRSELTAVRRQSDELAVSLRAEARTDPLTGLGNRRRWQEQLVHELDRSQRTGTRTAVAVVDLDRFKAVNDTQGHAAGDEVLREVASHLSRVVRKVDMVARVGGEEFALLLPDVQLPDAVQIIERVRMGMPAGMTCSVGLSVWNGEETGDALWHRADAAMYRAKAAGRDRLVVA